ncbi:unnamed protein product [Lymnaea stagnalis]|uniref:Protein kinase domain-containing protein n=1 Tax=Lymnaea stagnalis TaxID=6523 RepID=A0AAV2H0B1_LYMST
MTDGIVKIADFGMARFQSSAQCYSPDVATLHYRSPELLLGATKYGPAVDVWSFGCITVELFVRAKFITGTTEQAQLLCIIGMLGTIDRDTMPADLDLPYLDNMALPTNPHPNIKHVLKKYVKNQDAINLLLCLLQLNPDHRLDCATALSHSFFTASPKPENVKLDSVNNKPVTVTQKCFGHVGPLQVAGYNIIPPGVNIIPASHFIHQACVQGLLPQTHLKALFPQAQLHAMFPQTQLQTLLPQFLNPH